MGFATPWADSAVREYDEHGSREPLPTAADRSCEFLQFDASPRTTHVLRDETDRIGEHDKEHYTACHHVRPAGAVCLLVERFDIEPFPDFSAK